MWAWACACTASSAHIQTPVACARANTKNKHKMIENDLDRFIMNTAVFKRWLGNRTTSNVHALEPCKRTCAPVQIPMIPAIDDLNLKVWELANLIWQNLTLQIQRWAAVASEMHGSMQAIRTPWAAMAINSAIRQSTNNENMRFHKNSLTNHFASSDLHQWEGRSFDTGGYWAWGPNVWWLALMMLSVPFFCALHANSTRAFPGILDISSGTNVCGGVTSASGASLASGHRTPIYAVCSEWAAQQQQRCNDRCLTMQTRSWEKLITVSGANLWRQNLHYAQFTKPFLDVAKPLHLRLVHSKLSPINCRWSLWGAR